MPLFRRKSSKQTPEAATPDAVASTPTPVDDTVEEPISETPAETRTPALSLTSVDVPDFEEQNLLLDNVEGRLQAIQARLRTADVEPVEPVEPAEPAEIIFSDGIEASMGRINDIDLRAAIDLEGEREDSDFERRFAEFASAADERRVQSWIDDY